MNNIKCIIEVKNHINDIRQEQINRFLNTDLQNNNYNCGIFISLKSDFIINSGIKDFDIILTNNKPSIFISNFCKNTDNIRIAIKILNYLLSNTNNTQDDLIKFTNSLKKQLELFKSLEEILHNNLNNLNKSLILINNQKNDIDKLLNINIIDTFTCNICNKTYTKKFLLNRHQKKCN